MRSLLRAELYVLLCEFAAGWIYPNPIMTKNFPTTFWNSDRDRIGLPSKRVTALFESQKGGEAEGMDHMQVVRSLQEAFY